MVKTPSLISAAELSARFLAFLVYPDGSRVYIENFYKSERAARNAAIRARARLVSIGVRISSIHTATASISVTGWSAPVQRGLFPSDYNHIKDAQIENYF